MFDCECGRSGDHPCNVQGDEWIELNAKRYSYHKAAKYSVYIVNSDHVAKTDRILEQGAGWAIVEDLTEE